MFSHALRSWMFRQFWPLASQTKVVRTLLAPLRVTPLWLAWPTLRVWWVPSRSCRRSRATVTVVSPLWGGGGWCFYLSAGVAFRLFCASALFPRRVALLASGWGYLPFDSVESSISGRGVAGGVFLLAGVYTACLFSCRPYGAGESRMSVRSAALRRCESERRSNHDLFQIYIRFASKKSRRRISRINCQLNTASPPQSHSAILTLWFSAESLDCFFGRLYDAKIV